MILVTGGSGFIGQHVCSVLSAHIKDVIALDRRSSDMLTNTPSYSLIECDITDKSQVERVFKQYSFTTVVHLASLLNTTSRKNPLAATQVNIVGSLNLLEAARKYYVPKLIYGSSISVYGSKSARGQDCVVETTLTTPEDIYGATKRYVEIVGETYSQQFGIRFVALRIASVLGPGALNTSSSWRSEIFEKLGLSHRVEVALPYASSEALPFVHVEDIADMVELLVDSEKSLFTVYNTPSETWVLNDLAKYIESLDNNLRITFGQSVVNGIPKMVNGRRFQEEFNYTPVSLKRRLLRVAKK